MTSPRPLPVQVTRSSPRGSGWSKLTDRIVRVDDSATDAFDLEGINTTSTSLYPAGGGAGTARKISGWTQLAQITNSSSEGGEQQFLTYQFLESDSEKRIPTTKSAAGITFTIADDPTLPGYQLAKEANDDRLPRAVLLTLDRMARYVPPRFRIVGAALLGAIAGLGGVLATVALMLLKTGMHSHIFPDYPPGEMLEMLQRAPTWALAGALAGVGLALAVRALRPNRQ